MVLGSTTTLIVFQDFFLTTLAILIFLLCLSMFQVAVYKLPPEQAINGKTGSISLGVYFTPVSTPSIGTDSDSKLDYFRYNGLPLSNSAITLFLIIWLLGSFNYFARNRFLRSSGCSRFCGRSLNHKKF